MTIKHLVISGGGPLGFRYLGSLEKLEQEGFWNINNIESIYLFRKSLIFNYLTL